MIQRQHLKRLKNEEAAQEEEKVSIEFWHAMSGSGQESLDAIVKGFNESQDNYEVVAEFQGTYEESLTKLRGVGGTKDAPAITQVFEVGTKYMIDSGYIEPMQSFIDKDNYDLVPTGRKYFELLQSRWGTVFDAVQFIDACDDLQQRCLQGSGA